MGRVAAAAAPNNESDCEEGFSLILVQIPFV